MSKSTYIVTYKAVETDATTQTIIEIEADIVELAGGVLVLSRKLAGDEKVAAAVEYGRGEPEEDPAGLAGRTYTEIVFLMPLHRVIHVEKIKKSKPDVH